MFTASCFIRKNTPELINKLIDLGYVKALFDEEYTKSDAYGLIVDQGDIPHEFREKFMPDNAIFIN